MPRIEVWAIPPRRVIKDTKPIGRFIVDAIPRIGELIFTDSDCDGLKVVDIDHNLWANFVQVWVKLPAEQYDWYPAISLTRDW